MASVLILHISDTKYWIKKVSMTSRKLALGSFGDKLTESFNFPKRIVKTWIFSQYALESIENEKLSWRFNKRCNGPQMAPEGYKSFFQLSWTCSFLGSSASLFHFFSQIKKKTAKNTKWNNLNYPIFIKNIYI